MNPSSPTPLRSPRLQRAYGLGVAAGLMALGVAPSGWADLAIGDGGLPVDADFEWDIELTSMSLGVSGALMPLGPGWGPMLTDIHIGESAALASTGKAFAYRLAGTGPVQNGDQFFVSSFFDVFFDISVADSDPAINFGGSPVPVGPLTFPDNGPAHMGNSYYMAANTALPNFGLIPPPEAFPYIGHFTVEIPLGADLNGNGQLDKIKFTTVAHQVGGENRTFVILPDGTVLDRFDSTLDLSGAVVDLLDDPPFTVTLTGPVTASSHLVGLVIPESSTVVGGFACLGLVGGTVWRRCRKQRDSQAACR